MSPFLKFVCVLLLISSCSNQKKITIAPDRTLDRLHQHIEYLSADKLEGRRAGTAGEKLAMDYIAGQFSEIGLSQKGSEGYFQPFPINDGKQITAVNQFSINGNMQKSGTDYFPFPYSADINILASPAIAVQEADMPWFYDLKEILDDNKSNPHFDLGDYIYNNSKKAHDRGASAVILYNTAIDKDNLVFNAMDRSERLKIPVIYVTRDSAIKYFKDPSASVDLKLNTEIKDKVRTGHNVCGYLDNGAKNTVILGAHFDHLGYGEDGNSMIRHFDSPMIHNGADDNASGTAALIELARKLKASPSKENNYLFIAFSAEEMGLFGSKYFTDHPTVDLGNVSYMINMDMVGRLNDSTKVLTVGGIGTSPAWNEVYDLGNRMNGTNVAMPFIYKYDSSGTGPSDHTSFYRKDIPVLFYFTGLHQDYHKPSDDADKINYSGELAIINHIYSVIEKLEPRGKLAFLKTRETQTSSNASFKVTMGIMPDYTFAGTGVRADAVSDGRPAAKAGMKAGDVIIQLGEYNTPTMEAYMQTLGKFKKGDKTKVKFKRGNEILEAPVEF